MAKKRLNNSHRTLLKELASNKIVAFTEKQKMDEAYKKADELILAEYEKQFPENARDILVKYGVSDSCTCIPILAFDGDTGKNEFYRFYASKEVILPIYWVRRDTYRLQIVYDGDIHQAINRYNKAKTAHTNRFSEIKNDYYKLIVNARYFEDVVEVWEEAKELEPKICGKSTSLITLSDDVKDRIKNDVAERKKKKLKIV